MLLSKLSLILLGNLLAPAVAAPAIIDPGLLKAQTASTSDLHTRDKIEMVIGGDDIANAAKYARHKIPEVAKNWKQAIKQKVVDKLSDDGEAQDRRVIVNSDLVKLLEDGRYDILKQDGSTEPGSLNEPVKPRPKSIKTNAHDLGVKDYEYVPSQKAAQDDDYDSFED